ncbi:2-hydroxyacid dehydrogenase [Polycladidibacter hongkongensis]|uniref:2-hydroxyacid dehydrogenase n=1 Tax=Polycladidibacter hongkongensis TaxID=1647556 RepID=UPI000830CECE|nr:2-hydroxyacid dehydrogenase [Pseudovibrio hongkongensis]
MSEILLMSPYAPAHINPQLAKIAPFHNLEELGSIALLSEELRDKISVIAAKGTSKLDRQTLALFPNLQLIAVYGVGTEGIDLSYAKEQGILVTTTPDSLSDAVADLALTHAFALSRRVVEGDRFIRSGHWQQRKLGLGFSLRGKTIGLFGYGRIGQKIAQSLRPFAGEIVYTAKAPVPNSPDRFCNNLKDVAAEARVLIIAAAGGKETQGAVNRDVLRAVGPDGLLINVARGSIVNETDLISALENNEIGGAALDVFSQEPQVPTRLLEFPNVIVSPHIGSATEEAREHMGQTVLANVRAHFSGVPLLNPLP